MKALFLSLLILLCLIGSVGAEEHDLVIIGGIVVTMDAERRVFSPGMIVVDDGAIVEVGDVRENIDAREILEVSEHAVVPGLINAHTHLPIVLFRGLADDLELEPWLREVIFPAEAANVTEEFVAAGTRLGLAELIKGGVTTYADMYYFEDAVARETAEAGMRAVLGQTMLDFPAPDWKSWPETVAAVKKFHSEWKSHPLITPALAPHAPYTVGPKSWRDVVRLSDELEMPILTHLAEAPLEVEHTLKHYAKRPIPYLESLGVLSERLTGAHVIYAELEEVRRLAESKVGAAHCPESNMKVAVGVSPVPELLRAGVNVGLGTDGAASNNDLDMWQEMDTCAKLHKNERRDPTVMPAESVFALATIGGARALHMESRIGSLEVGKAADFAVIDLGGLHLQPRYDNIYSLLVYSVRGSDISHTIVNGRVLMRERRLLTLDEAAIREETDFYRDKIRESLKK